jgi:hypothetical protein
MKNTAARLALAAIIAITALGGVTGCSTCPGQEVTISQSPAKWNGFKKTTTTCPDSAGTTAARKA